MTNDEGHYYVLWDDEAIMHDGTHPLFKDAKNINDERVILANIALNNKGHKSLTPEEKEWMLDNVDTKVWES
ncbi:MAG: hypothetical protein K2X74_10975 [Acetobacteraceae bacterium]|nr:hypothetical protein [Acetobacteraceae bacterium]